MCMLKLKFIVMIHALFTSIFKENEVHSFIDVRACVRAFAPPLEKVLLQLCLLRMSTAQVIIWALMSSMGY